MITGKWIIDKAVNDRLNKISRGLKGSYIRKAFREVWKAMKAPLKQLIPKRFGVLRQSMGNKSTVKKGLGRMLVGARTNVEKQVPHGKKYINARPAWYNHLANSGTKRSKAHDYLGRLHKADARWYQIMFRSIKNSIGKTVLGG